jgi:hypothetical protein
MDKEVQIHFISSTKDVLHGSRTEAGCPSYGLHGYPHVSLVPLMFLRPNSLSERNYCGVAIELTGYVSS